MWPCGCEFKSYQVQIYFQALHITTPKHTQLQMGNWPWLGVDKTTEVQVRPRVPPNRGGGIGGPPPCPAPGARPVQASSSPERHRGVLTSWSATRRRDCERQPFIHLCVCVCVSLSVSVCVSVYRKVVCYYSANYGKDYVITWVNMHVCVLPSFSPANNSFALFKTTPV